MQLGPADARLEQLGQLEDERLRLVGAGVVEQPRVVRFDSFEPYAAALLGPLGGCYTATRYSGCR